MSTILHITASIRDGESVSRSLSSKLVDGLREKSGADVITRDLSKNDLPYMDADRFAANLAPYAERDDDQHELAKIADTLIDELKQADTIVIGTPIYNFTMPSTLKAWADLVARAGTTFKYTETGPQGLMTGKKAYIAIASGGTPVGSEIDFLTPWLKFFLGFLGITDVELVAADGIMGEGGEEKIAEAHEQVERMAA
ncbi:FMN-dependent NADH-azoreductase [Altererythrobacter xiamenensis]|uniref:FMN dependent NADH:quinone oxidoreductase n=1 Tax=Altererythrobacter xiamenensis TaxID=1316679 RepID=A0A1Y6E8V5_9SPHN|nr:NAD(P)H-dependent oxidoreductase [Altererythrobacter xiamenensis]SMQ59038.1 FMN-dependent NADH-azoreductase [Altererythrobacter xiamenensis]